MVSSVIALAMMDSPARAGNPSDARRSGYADMQAENQALQRDDFANPGMLTVRAGARLWHQPAGNAQQSCASCHGEPQTMKGVATRYPAFDTVAGAPFNLDQRINACRQRHQQVSPLTLESPDLLALSTLVAHQSRGLPVAPPDDPRLQAFRERGRQHFEQRIGQLNFACKDCHDTLAGLRLGASRIPQAHPTGYPLYRLAWQSVGTLQRRLRNCMTGVRAEMLAPGALEAVELELYLYERARGMLIETPAVRP